MTAHPCDVRDGFNIFRELAEQSRFIHLPKENPFPGRSADSPEAPWEDENDLLPLSVCLSGKPLGKGSGREEWQRDGQIPTKKFLRDFVFATEVINHNRNLRAESGFQSRGGRGDKGKLMGHPIQNLDFQS